MSILTLLFVVALVLILVGALLGKLTWDRAIVLLLVGAVIYAVIAVLLPRIHG